MALPPVPRRTQATDWAVTLASAAYELPATKALSTGAHAVLLELLAHVLALPPVQAVLFAHADAQRAALEAAKKVEARPEAPAPPPPQQPPPPSGPPSKGKDSGAAAAPAPAPAPAVPQGPVSTAPVVSGLAAALVRRGGGGGTHVEGASGNGCVGLAQCCPGP